MELLGVGWTERFRQFIREWAAFCESKVSDDLRIRTVWLSLTNKGVNSTSYVK